MFNLEFKVKNIKYRNANNRYTIIGAEIIDHNNPKGMTKEKTIMGYFPMLFKGDIFKGTGEEKLHKVYGYYVSLLGFPKLSTPENEKALAEFLSKRVNRLGIKTAKEIVSHLGLNAIEEIKNDYTKLVDIGIKEKKAKRIYEYIVLNESYSDLCVFLQSLGIEMRIANKVYEMFKEHSLIRVKDNPYSICLNGNVGFKYAEKIAKGLNKDKHSLDRIKMAIIEYLNLRAKNNGDICVNKSIMVNNFNKFLDFFKIYTNNDITVEEIEKALNDLAEKNFIAIEKCLDDEMIYLSINNFIENDTVRHLNRILKEDRLPFCCKEDIDKFLEEYESKYYELDIKQKEYVYMALKSGVSILTGGPGTGKTNTTNVVMQCIEHINPKARIVLLAPTGKASNRMTEVSGKEACTIHRALNINPYNNSEVEEIYADFLFIDESSMMDAEIFWKLIGAIGNNTRVCFIGDVDQLPSVGPGLIFKDLIESGRIPTTKLTKIFRQKDGSLIVDNAHKINAGKDSKCVDGIDVSNKPKSNFLVAEENDPIKLRQRLVKGVKNLMSKHSYKLSDICVLSPIRKGDLGIYELNRMFQNTFNPSSYSKSEYEIDSMNVFREGDRVIQIQNNYDLDVFNGDVGTISKIAVEVEDGMSYYRIYVDYPHKEFSVVYEEKDIEQLELAYAMTIHKSQGSEFKVVVMVLHQSQKAMLNRNIVYTGITRAKEYFYLVGELLALDYAINHISATERITRLKYKLNR